MYIEVAKHLGDCLTEDREGEILFELLNKHLSLNNKVKVSFANVDVITSAFVGTLIWKLYNTFPEQIIKQYLEFIDIDAVDKELIRLCIKNTKRHLNNPTFVIDLMKEISEDET